MLRNRSLAALLAAEVVSTTGSQMTWLALPWFVLLTSGSATRMSLVVAAELIGGGLGAGPGGQLVGPVGGGRADVRDHRRGRLRRRRVHRAVVQRAADHRPGTARRGRGCDRARKRAVP